MQMVHSSAHVVAHPKPLFPFTHHQQFPAYVEPGSQSLYAFSEMDSGSDAEEAPIDQSQPVQIDSMKAARQSRKKNKLAKANMIGNVSIMSSTQPFGA